MKARNRFKVSLKLSRKSVSELLTFGFSVVSHINGTAFFATPTPSLATISTALADLQTAVENANGGGILETQIQDDKRLIVEDLLTACGHYVEDTANDPTNKDQEATVIESAGMTVKPVPVHQKRVFTAKAGELPGTIKLTAAFVRRGTHEWEYTATPQVESSWLEATPTTKASTTITGLTRGTLMTFRHRAITIDGPTAWETTTEVIVP